MYQFVASYTGSDVKPITTSEGVLQNYTVVDNGRVIRHKVIGCHKQMYLPYAIYGCHYILNSIVRVVPLKGEDGTQLEDVSICHMDTSPWNPHHLLFLILKSKPGPLVCHFLATEDIAWISK